MPRDSASRHRRAATGIALAALLTGLAPERALATSTCRISLPRAVGSADLLVEGKIRSCRVCRLSTALAAVTLRLASSAPARVQSVGIGSALHGQLVDDGDSAFEAPACPSRVRATRRPSVTSRLRTPVAASAGGGS